MVLSTTERAAILALMPELGPDHDDGSVLALVRDHWSACLDEVRADPGFDKVRAALIRVLRTELSADTDVRRALRDAVTVVSAFPEQVLDGDATLLLSRHPAWVGLCALELAEWDPTLSDDPLTWAATLARAGFTTLAGKATAGQGEVLWALAEEANGVAWTDLGRRLLEQAVRAPFADEDHRVQVQLLLALHRLDSGEPDAAELLEAVASSPDADAHTATHARHVLAELRARSGDSGAARYWLRQALASVDPDEDPSVAERLRAELAGYDLDDDEPPPTRAGRRFF